MSRPLDAAIGRNIRAARKNAGLTQADLGRKLGVAQTTVSYWETAERETGVAELVALAGALGVPLLMLLGDVVPGGGEIAAAYEAGWADCAAAVAAATRRGGAS